MFLHVCGAMWRGSVAERAQRLGIPPADLPRERLRNLGAAALGDAELIAVLLGTGGAGVDVLTLARRLLAETGGIAELSEWNVGALSRIAGVGQAKAARLVAAVELGTRVSERRRLRDPRRFTCSRDFYHRFGPRLSLLRQEVFVVVGLTVKNEVVCEHTVAKGSTDECAVAPKDVFRPVVTAACSRLVVLHNHPSGDPTPSGADIALTHRLEEGAQMLGLVLLDHLVIGRGAYASLRDMGVLGPL